jgi:predicted metalloprotease with PDZ domain
MIEYLFEPKGSFFNVTLKIPASISGENTLYMANFRPGRYEPGNFWKNIFGLKYKSAGKTTKPALAHNLAFKIPPNTPIEITYRLYAYQLSAGNTYIDNDFILINPVNACFLLLDLPHVSYQIKIKSEWELFSTLKKVGPNCFIAENENDFLDNPIIGSHSSISTSYQCNGKTFFIHGFGALNNFTLKNIVNRIDKITHCQLEWFGSFPSSEFHFYLMLANYPVHHGVEHLKNTVCLLGPASQIDQPEKTDELIALFSHELFHVWNVKDIRPLPLLPYPLKQQGHCVETIIAEGFTTYLAEKARWISCDISNEVWVKILEKWTNNYLQKPSRFGQTLYQSAMLLGINGYAKEFSDFTQSIYNEGALFAFLLDIQMQKKSAGKTNLSHLLKIMYEHFGNNQKGYTIHDIKFMAEKLTNAQFNHLFENFLVNGHDIKHDLIKALTYCGIQIKPLSDLSNSEKLAGIVFKKGTNLVLNVVVNSPAENAGIRHGAEILNTTPLHSSEFCSWDDFERLKSLEITYKLEGIIRTTCIHLNPDFIFQKWTLSIN